MFEGSCNQPQCGHNIPVASGQFHTARLAHSMGFAHQWMEAHIRRNSKVMRLHILSGSLVDAAEAGGCPMDASVWSRLPDDMLWRVLGFVPAAKLFQLHTVSRKWQRVLTSRQFHSTIAAAAAAAEQQRRRQRGVVACATQLGSVTRPWTSEVMRPMRVVDVDLTSFVPSWFWTRHSERGCNYASFSVVAAGNGLVCICNHLMCRCVCSHLTWCECDRAAQTLEGARYCVLNPLTRTCVVLPPAPLVPPLNFMLRPLLCLLPSEGAAAAAAAPALTLVKWDDHGCHARWEKRMEAAACVLADGGLRWITLHTSVVATTQPTHWPRWPPALTQCGGETFFFHAGRLHVLAAPPTGTATVTSKEEAQGSKKRRRLVESADAAAALSDTLDGPSVASLGLDAAAIGYEDDVFLVAHRGAIFLVAQLLRRPTGGADDFYKLDPELVAGVWRLDRRARAWEPVSRLDAVHARRLVESAPVPLCSGGKIMVCGAWVVRDLLCCEFGTMDIFRRGWCGRVTVGLRRFVLGFNHDAGEWEVVLDDNALVVDTDDLQPGDWRPARVLELRPDLFLS